MSINRQQRFDVFLVIFLLIEAEIGQFPIKMTFLTLFKLKMALLEGVHRPKHLFYC